MSRVGSGVQRPGGRQAQTGAGLTGGGPAGRTPAVSQQAHPQGRLKSAGGRLHQQQPEVGNTTCQGGRSEDLPSTRPPPYPRRPCSFGSALFGLGTAPRWLPHTLPEFLAAPRVPLIRFHPCPFIFQGILLDPGKTHRAESWLHTQTRKPPLSYPSR